MWKPRIVFTLFLLSVLYLMVVLCFLNPLQKQEAGVDIGEGYRVICVGPHHFDLILPTGRRVVLDRDNSLNIAVSGHFSTDSVILIRLSESESLSQLVNGRPQNFHEASVFYFIVTKRTNKIIGPLDGIAFLGHSEMVVDSPICWTEPVFSESPARGDGHAAKNGFLMYPVIIVAEYPFLLLIPLLVLPLCLGSMAAYHYIERNRRSRSGGSG
jgi:hypothetical protein